jgi:argininosuccinate lyase
MKNFEYFIESFSYDYRLAEIDILCSISHTKMLLKSNIITNIDCKKIILGLESILKDIKNGYKIPKAEDIHFAVEKELIKRIGNIGGKMHTARSRNDQISTDLRFFLKKEILIIINLIEKTQRTFVKKAEKNIDVIMPGFTHLQHAQPILASHYILAYVHMFQRDKERFFDCYKRTDVLTLGSAALSGTSFKIDRMYLSKSLNFKQISENSLDAVSDRDFIIEFAFCVSLLSLHFTRLCEEIILWINPEFCYINIDNDFTSGSSIMPQKRNPDYAEIIRGKSGRIFGNLISLLVLIKSLPLGYNRDLQEDKIFLFDSVDNIKKCLCIIDKMINSLEFIKENTIRSTAKGLIESTEIADYLVKKNIPFRTAHTIVTNIVEYCNSNHKKLKELSIDEYKNFSIMFENDIFECLDIKNIVNSKTSYGGTSKKSVLVQIKNIKNKYFK